MLTLQSISGPRDQQSLLATIDPARTTWIVSDLKSKIDLQRRLLGERDFLHGESVMRASELWRTLLTRLRPDMQVVSIEFALTLIGESLAERSLDWARSPGAAQTAYQYLCQLMPILSHPQGEEMMQEWFTAHEASQVRWGRWFALSSELWREFIERGIVAAPWISGVLVNELGFEKIWDRNLVFDLGAELNQVEGDLIAILANAVSVTVLQPKPVWRDEYRRSLLAYDILERKPKTVRTSFSSGDSDSAAIPPREYRKFTTMLGEVKQAIATSRQWLDKKKLQANQIAIVAPDIELYWPVLSAYLDEEGIPCQKHRVARIHTFPDINQWMSTLRLKAGGHDESDLEVSVFQKSDTVGMPYDRFKTLYAAIYSRDDLGREAEIARLYEIEFAAQEIVARDTFVAWSLKGLPERCARVRIEAVFQRLFQECPANTRLTMRRWLQYFEEIVSRSEVRLADGIPDGIACLNLTSAENAPATHMFLLGLTERALRQGSETGVLHSDIQSLAYEFGFHLQSIDAAKLEFEARWISDNSSRHLVLTVPETDFEGAVQAPAWFWVKGAIDANSNDEVNVPELTRWDEIQKQLADDHSHPMRAALEQDLGEKPLPNFAEGVVSRLSASAIEDYLACPFIFASKTLFKLSDQPNLDLDVDASNRGRLLHAIFERLTREPRRFDYTKAELEQVIDLSREQAAVQIYDERMWPAMRSRHAESAKRFLAFEKTWKEKFPQTTVLDREVKIQGFIDPETARFSREAKPGFISFSGSIDRIDSDNQGHAAVIDYKSSGTGLGQWGKWIENDELQLLLYSLAFESGLSEHAPQAVVSAVYYVARSLDRDKGFKTTDVEQGLYLTDDRKHNKMTTEERERLFSAARETLLAVLTRMRAGEFKPVPKDVKMCRTCRWSVVCRAPHLNN